MNFNKSFFTKPELFQLYFLLLRGFYIYSIVTCLYFSFQMFDLMSGFFTITSIIVIGFQFYISLHAQRLTLARNYWGPLLALGLGLFIFIGFGMPIACLGFYALLNKEFRARYLSEEIPAWMSDVLTHLDKLTAQKLS